MSLKFYFFHLLAYRDIDLEEVKKVPSIWVFLPNSNYDPEKTRAYIDQYLDEFELADRLGYDGVALSEHHQTGHSMLPTPTVVAGALSQRVKNANIAILGRALPILANPLSIAEEFSLLDHLTGGRIICGFVRGNGPEYFSTMSNPAESHARYLEAHDLIKRAWTETGPFPFEGEYYHFPYVNVTPRPYTRPHPPIWIPSTGSIETISWAAAAERRYTYLQIFSAAKSVERNLGVYKDEAAKAGYEATPEQLGWSMPVYVAETDEIARKEAKPHIENLFNKYLRIPIELLQPPGYSSVASFKRAMEAKKEVIGKDVTIEALMEQDVVLVGSADTVREKIAHYRKSMGFGIVNAVLHFATLPGELTRKNIEGFAKGVMDPLRAAEAETARQSDPV